mmetsp:Transcript_3736/g.7100  ORF Transcript_3736/g.7100 Transcript_3736/m.7100 type:complete len:253 (-) Transcript_3736:84-842(-)
MAGSLGGRRICTKESSLGEGETLMPRTHSVSSALTSTSMLSRPSSSAKKPTMATSPIVKSARVTEVTEDSSEAFKGEVTNIPSSSSQRANILLLQSPQTALASLGFFATVAESAVRADTQAAITSGLMLLLSKKDFISLRVSFAAALGTSEASLAITRRHARVEADSWCFESSGVLSSPRSLRNFSHALVKNPPSIFDLVTALTRSKAVSVWFLLEELCVLEVPLWEHPARPSRMHQAPVLMNCVSFSNRYE